MIVKRWWTVHIAAVPVQAVCVWLAGFDPQLLGQMIPDPAWRKVAQAALVLLAAMVNTWKKVPPVDNTVVPLVDVPVDPNTTG